MHFDGLYLLPLLAWLVWLLVHAIADEIRETRKLFRRRK